MSESQQPPKSDPTLKRLDRFVGTWSMEGRLVGSDKTTITGLSRAARAARLHGP